MPEARTPVSSGGDALVVSHTHWDREWYHAAEVFRHRLLSVVEAALTRQSPFLLDGQAIVLEDYLAWRPEQRATVAARMARGDVEAGPWYVLPDLLLPSGEGLIRNLLTGQRIVRGLGGMAPPVLYSPDAFGHSAAGPVLAEGFGLPVAVVWRGYGGRGWPSGDAARWRHPGGSEAQLYHLPPSGYEHANKLTEHSVDQVHALVAELRARATLSPLLLLDGADHHKPAGSLATDLTDLGLIASTLTAFAAARVRSGAHERLPEVRGELRASPSYVWSLQGTFSARAPQKRMQARLERQLVHDMEPWAALAWWTRGLEQQASEQEAWRLALQNQPHDTLCGCSIDAVALAMDHRGRQSAMLADELRERSLDALLTNDPEVLRDRASAASRVVVIRNRVARARAGVVECEIDVPLGPVRVGPGSAQHHDVHRECPDVSLTSRGWQELSRERVVVLHEGPRHYPRAMLVQRIRALTTVDPVPPLGLRCVDVNEGAPSRRSRQRVRVMRGVMHNDHVRVWWDKQDGLCLDSDWGRWSHMLGFEVTGEQGDLYTTSTIPGSVSLGACRRARVTRRGPLRAELQLDWRIPVPGREVRDATGQVVRHLDAHHDVTVLVTLDAGARHVRLHVGGVNRQDDQRLRMVLQTGGSGPHLADAALGAVWRHSTVQPAAVGDVEVVAGTAPLHRFVATHSTADGRGLSVISDGLGEYEVEDGRVSVTLLRSVGELSRSALPERPGHAGWPRSTPLAQCQGSWEAVFALVPHGTIHETTLALIREACDDVLQPLLGTTRPDVDVTQVVGPELEGAALDAIACKRSEGGTGIVLRCLNTAATPQAGTWHLQGMCGAWLVRLDETRLGALPVHEDRVRFVVPPHAVLSILVQRR